jgi:hypothetical protein
MYRYARDLHLLVCPPFQSQEAGEPITECGGKDVDVVEQSGFGGRITMGLRFRMAFRMPEATLSDEIFGEIDKNFRSSIIAVLTRPGRTFVTEIPFPCTSCLSTSQKPVSANFVDT